MPNEIQLLQQEISEIRKVLGRLILYDRIVLDKTMQILDGRNMQVGTTTGTKIGTAATQKLGFFNKTPIVQPGAITAPTGGINIDAEARTAINSIRTTLTNLGLSA